MTKYASIDSATAQVGQVGFLVLYYSSLNGPGGAWESTCIVQEPVLQTYHKQPFLTGFCGFDDQSRAVIADGIVKITSVDGDQATYEPLDAEETNKQLMKRGFKPGPYLPGEALRAN